MAFVMSIVMQGLIFASILLSVSGEICWYNTIYNSLTPSLNSSTDFEGIPPPDEVAKICPTGDNSSLTIRCYGSQNITYRGTMNRTCDEHGSTGKYLLTCAVNHGGMLCAPHKGNNCTCPDFKAQFGCECADGQGSGQNGSGSGNGSGNSSVQLTCLAGWSLILILMTNVLTL